MMVGWGNVAIDVFEGDGEGGRRCPREMLLGASETGVGNDGEG
jgi:hypothetical protein